jgi:hypothetical protein
MTGLKDEHTDILARLREACTGHPHAEIPWPHRLLHDAVAEIDNLRGVIRAIETNTRNKAGSDMRIINNTCLEALRV